MLVQDCWDDQSLYPRLLARDARALESLITRYSRELTYFVRMVLAGVGTTQDAEECVADLFMTVWDEIEDFDPRRGSLGAWLSMRAKYLALDRRRHILRRMGTGGAAAGATRPPHQADLATCLATSDPDASVDGLIERRERQEELRRVLEDLPELDRLLIYLRYFRLAGTEEIAARTGLTRRAIDTRLWRTRRQLRVALESFEQSFEERTHGPIRAV